MTSTDEPGDRPAQEPWDFARVVELYNARAKSSGGWFFEPDGRTEGDLRAGYLYYPQYFPDLATFAEGLYYNDQLT